MYGYSIEKHDLQFLKAAKTSRNIFRTRTIHLIKLIDLKTGNKGIGEAAPLALLSIDDIPEYEDILRVKLDEFCEHGKLEETDLDNFPSIRFGIETAYLDLTADREGRMFDTPFTRGELSIPVNGLVWMNDSETMYEEAIAKIEAGFDVIKFKVGALDFDEECRMLEKIRNRFSAFKVTLRLDANGAFKSDEAMEQLNELSRFEIHSIEQPIGVGHWDYMQKLCAEGPIDIALDEELIPLSSQKKRTEMLKNVCPQYIILKPNLIGGLAIADDWVHLATKHNIGWWATSALESNVGLNAISQWVSQYPDLIHQGLGTGSLFSNNLPSRLQLKEGRMKYIV
ncbi:MAG: o-succinylbenzoate synthase [Bacteroidia bacterium]